MRERDIAFKDVNLGQREGILTFDKKRIVLKGHAQISLMHNSWKFGPQIQIAIFTRNLEDLRVESRSGSMDWQKMEIDFPLKDMDKIIEGLQRLKNRT